MESTNRSQLVGRLAILFALALGAGAAQGCAAAVVGAGAGIAGTAYFTSRGVGSTVYGSVDNLATRTQIAMSQMDIPVTETKSENGGKTREYKGTKGDLDVTVSLSYNDDKTTKVEVDARRNLVTWDKDYAKTLMDRIVSTKA
jgi:hypothetical protein